MTSQATHEEHLKFWRTFARLIDTGEPACRALKTTGTKLAGTAFESVGAALIADIETGRTLSEAMGKHPNVFSPMVTKMVRAGEAGGVVDVVAQRIIEGIVDGSFPPPGTDLSTDKDQACRFWRAFGRLLSSGVPILQALDLLAEAATSDRFRAALLCARNGIQNGKDLVTPLRESPDVFPVEVCAAIAKGEREGSLEKAAFAIADAIAADDLSSLTDPAAESAADADEETAGVIQTVSKILLNAFEQRASDIHFDSTEDGKGRVRYRIDGVLREVDPPPEGMWPAVISRLKIMGGLNVAERRLPQDGRIMLNVKGRDLDLRVSVVPAIFGERIVLRILDRAHVMLDLPRMGIEGEDLERLRGLAGLPNGIVICTGPTGSGKTTLLYGMLQEANRPERCVMTVEDPVEYTIPGVAQIPVRPAIGLTFPHAVRSLLRQDPDVILIGEIRDLESAQIAVQAALTGHLIMTSLHTNSAVDALRRLIDIGLPPFLVNSSVAGIIAQRLVRKLCNECKEAAAPARHMLPPEALRLLDQHPDATFYSPKGCDACRGMGYRGRTAVHEILTMDDRVRELIGDTTDWDAVQKAAVATGMKTLQQAGILKAAAGITSIDEVVRVCGHR